MLKKALLLVGLFAANGYAAECEFEQWRGVGEGELATWPTADEISNDALWAPVDRWELNRAKVFKNTKGDVYAVTTVMADEDYRQGFSVVGTNLGVQLNGQPVVAAERTKGIFALELKKGSNILVIKIPKKAKGVAKVLLTKVGLQHIFVPQQKKIADARDAIIWLGERYSTYDTVNYLNRLAKLEELAVDADVDSLIEGVRYDALVRNNPEIRFDTVLFRETKNPDMPINWRGNSHYLNRGGKKLSPDFGDKFSSISLQSGELKVIYAPSDVKEGIMDIALDYSGTKFLYSGVNTKDGNFQMFEMNIDGSGKKQLTTSDAHDIDNYRARL